MGVLELLQHLQLVIDHALVAADIFLEDDFNRNLITSSRLRLADNSVCTSTKSASEPVESPRRSRNKASVYGDNVSIQSIGEVGTNRTSSHSSPAVQTAC
jgi:hypothetical protein